MKHRLKKLLRRLLALFFGLTGLHALFRARRRGVPVLMFHNVGFPPETAYLPAHMKVSEDKLARLIGKLRRSGYGTLTVSGMVSALQRGEVPGDQVVLTFDDGYRDNLDRLVPILKAHDATATVYVQTGPMKGRLNWLHHYFWVLHKAGPHELAGLLAGQLDREELKASLAGLPRDPVAAEYQLKRLLKYEIAAADRDRVLQHAFRSIGGDEQALARSVYLGPDECRALEAAGVELGAHTENHLVLSSLDADQQRREIEGSLRDLQGWLGHDVTAFAYPYGRTWDYNAETLRILEELRFTSAITAMPGFNLADTPRLQLRRFAVNEDSALSEVLCEVDGVFEWFARRGLDLAV